MSWFSKKRDEEETGGFDILMLDPESGTTWYASDNGAPLLEEEGWTRVEEEYCGLCRCLVPLSSGLHPHN